MMRSLLLLALIFSTACTTTGTRPNSISGQAAPVGGDEAQAQTDEPNVDDMSAADFENFSTSEDPTAPFSAAVPKSMNELVEKWLNYFQGRGRKYMETYLERSGRYTPLMTRILKEEGLPEDLIYVVFIESGFSSTATSHASAVGYWQFIRGTGKSYGLRINGYMDERRDPELATRAAAQYFKSLYSLFGSWYLSLAAYNAGENRIKGAVMRNQSRNFWELAQKKQLPVETLNYVPKYLAARLIGKNPEKYGFVNVSYQDAIEFAKIPLEKPISMAELSKNLGIPKDEIRKLNPTYLTDFIPMVKGGDQFVRVPLAAVEVAQAAMEKSVVKNPKMAKQLSISDYVHYKVRRGDTLSHIARKFNTKINTIMQVNGMSRRTVLRLGQVIKIPMSANTRLQDESSASPQTRRTASVKVAKSPSKKKFSKPVAKTHVVKRGETLTDIARRYQVTLTRLASANDLKNKSMLYAGKQLVIPK